MRARYFGVNLSHDFFAYISGEEKQKIYLRCNENTAAIYSFEDEENKPVFAAVIEIDNDKIHVREVGGAFAFRMRWCLKLCEMLAEKTGKKIITFCTAIPKVEKVGARLGFEPHSGFNGEFIKRLA